MKLMKNTILLPVLFIILAIVVISVLLLRKRRKTNEQNELFASIETPIRLLPVDKEIEENKLVEIKDKNLLAKIDNIIPNAVIAGNNIQAAKAVQEAIQSGGIYQVIIPSGAKLDKSREIGGAFRGSYRQVQNSIQGNANWKNIDGAVAASHAANVANAVMNVGSMVVGQYYMSEINSKLENIDKSINKISGFQDSEFKSKIMSLNSSIKELTKFQSEVLGNNELRKIKINKLENLEEMATQLLGQANIQLDQFKKSNDYKQYQGQIIEADKWHKYQLLLLDILYQIDNLKYVLNLGSVSKEQCFDQYFTYYQMSDEVVGNLNKWHEDAIQRFEIDLNEQRRKRQGVEGFIFKLPALVKEDWGYKKVDKKTVKMINNQSSTINKEIDENNLFNEDVVLIHKNDKVYYLPNSKL